MRERILAGALLVALLLVVVGVSTWSHGLALIVAGVGLGVWAWLLFGEVSENEGE